MLKRYVSAALAALLVAGLTAFAAGTDATDQNARVHAHDQIAWRDGPPSLPEGAQFAVLEGDPAREGEYFAIRLRMPDGYRIPPHWHPVTERVTVISGAFLLGHGERFDEGRMQELGPGSYFSMPPEMRHFARVEGETELQLASIGPWDIRYVNPEDDPRRARTAR